MYNIYKYNYVKTTALQGNSKQCRLSIVTFFKNIFDIYQHRKIYLKNQINE